MDGQNPAPTWNMGNRCSFVFTRESSLPAFLRWYEMDFVHPQYVNQKATTPGGTFLPVPAPSPQAPAQETSLAFCPRPSKAEPKTRPHHQYETMGMNNYPNAPIRLIWALKQPSFETPKPLRAVQWRVWVFHWKPQERLGMRLVRVFAGESRWSSVTIHCIEGKTHSAIVTHLLASSRHFSLSLSLCLSRHRNLSWGNAGQGNRQGTHVVATIAFILKFALSHASH